MNTVLVLGAGASADYGLPIATALKTQIVEGSYDEYADFSRERIEAFQEKFRDSAYSSIDQYIERFPESSLIGKYIMAAQLYERERANFNRLFVPPGHGWYEILYEHLNSGDAELAKSAGTLKIVTFNYDRSLETFLIRRHARTHGVSLENAAREVGRIETVHIYGRLGDPMKYRFEDKRTAEEIALVAEKDVKVLSEEDQSFSGFYNSRFLDAYRFIEQSDRICFLGFGFSPENLGRFNVDWRNHEAKVIVGLHQGNSDNHKRHLVENLDFRDESTRVVGFNNRETLRFFLEEL